jgi:hypothetical protein
MPAGSTYTPIATHTIPSDITSYTFTSIPSIYTDLVLVGALSNDFPASLNLNVGNGSIDTGNNFSWRYLAGNGSTVENDNASNNGRILAGVCSSSLGQYNVIINFMNYANTSVKKTIVSRANDTSGKTSATVGLWSNTAAINQIRLIANGSLLKTGSTFTLYGIAAA